MKNIFLASCVAVLGFTLSATAEIATAPNIIESTKSAFGQYKDIPSPAIQVPTVVEVPFTETFSNRFDFAVLDTETNTFQPYFFLEHFRTERIPVSVSVQSGATEGIKMLDGDTQTFTEFALPESEQGQARLVLTSAKSMSLSGMTFLLDQYVALPTLVEIRALTSEGEKIVLARSPMRGATVVFPKTSAKEWAISLTYGQLLRITEVVLHEEGSGVISSPALRFLAQPGHGYQIYFDSDRSVPMRVGEAANLALDTDVLRLGLVTAQKNTGYTLADTDIDGVPDIHDNCVSISNADQKDVNTNDRGDICDDFDKDGVINSLDNCPNDPNYNQADIDGDKIGDVCDSEESRVTEKYPWLPWAGMGFAGLVLAVLFGITARGMMKKDSIGTEDQK